MKNLVLILSIVVSSLTSAPVFAQDTLLGSKGDGSGFVGGAQPALPSPDNGGTGPLLGGVDGGTKTYEVPPELFPTELGGATVRAPSNGPDYHDEGGAK